MKKTLNINIGNSIIHIEEDAYELLTGYLNEIKSHFTRSADDFEIVTDIENRIAEMFHEILVAEHKQIITIDDVKIIIAQMGTVKDFEISEDETEDYTGSTHATGVKRLYRDTENVVVAGVCSGLGHYLNIEERWIRLFAVLTMFAGGAGIVAYLVMWILVPRATSRSEKMYMKGEEVNLQGIIKNFQEEVASNQLIKRSRGFIGEFIDLLGKFISGTGKTVFKIISLFIMLLSGVMLLGLIVSLAAFLGVFDAGSNDIFPLSMVDEAYITPLLLAIFVFGAIPLLSLLLFSIRVAFNGRPISKSVSFALLIIWLAGVATGIYLIAKTSSEFKESAEFTQVAPLRTYATYTLTLDKSRFFSKEDSVKYKIDMESYKGRIILDERNGPFNRPRDVRINIEKSDNGKTSVVQNYSSQGKTFDGALKNAQNIHYDFFQQDSLINFSPKLHLTRNVNWRNQEVKLTLKVPVGTTLIIKDDVDDYMDNYRSWSCQNESDDENGITTWVMTADGLKCKHELEKKTDATEAEPAE
jgi:phage shock protein PspC (stress-responsive transcriptional regulator)